MSFTAWTELGTLLPSTKSFTRCSKARSVWWTVTRRFQPMYDPAPLPTNASAREPNQAPLQYMARTRVPWNRPHVSWLMNSGVKANQRVLLTSTEVNLPVSWSPTHLDSLYCSEVEMTEASLLSEPWVLRTSIE